MISKRAQVNVGNGPAIVMMVGFVFLLMATFAYINIKAGDSFAVESTGSTINETLTTVSEKGEDVAKHTWRNIVCSISSATVRAQNSSSTGDAYLSSGNFTITNCKIAFKGVDVRYNNTNWNVSYTYTWDRETVATNITDDSNTEIESNTSMAGIILTISLVGIVLSLLVGVFLAVRNRGL